MRLLYIFLIIVIIGVFSGCEDEIDVPFVIDEDEIARYIADSDLGRALFPTDNYIIDSVPFIYPQDVNAVFVHLIDSLERRIITSFPFENNTGSFIDEPFQDFGSPFGRTIDAEVEVRDKLYLNTLRIEGIDTTEYKYAQEIRKYGYFMKLGDDGEKFKGWILRGFNGGTPRTASPVTRVSLYHSIVSNDSIFTTNTYNYQEFESMLIGHVLKFDPVINDTVAVLDTIMIVTNESYAEIGSGLYFIEHVSPGEQIISQVDQSSNYMFFTAGIHTDTGFIQNTFELNGLSELETILDIPNDPSGTWGFIYFQEYYRNAGDTFSVPEITSLLNRKWVVPYYIE